MDEERNPPSPLFEPKCKKIYLKIFIFILNIFKNLYLPA